MTQQPHILYRSSAAAAQQALRWLAQHGITQTVLRFKQTPAGEVWAIEIPRVVNAQRD